MQVLFIGGASSVGASCLAVELGGHWFVIDCGVRTDRRSDPLPDLSQLEGKDVRAIFVTHAHSDHIGALPLLWQSFPTVPLFTSRATSFLLEVMLADAVKVMAKRAAEEMELPLYPQSLVAGMLNQLRPIPVGGEAFTVPVLPGITITTSRAGHIAGAMSLGFSASDGSLVVSGDLSLTPQRTVQGAVPPATKSPDLLVLESTYGARLHPNRQAEEARLAQAVAEGIERGGHVLIPAFGLGRGQELLLVLQDAQEKGQIPAFPIYIDGLVGRICSVYRLLPEALTPRLARAIRQGYRPFTGDNITFVYGEQERKRVLAGKPACIISSSGMLTGGPSAWYAAQLLGDERASILITGYQDEESPGRKLLDVAEGKQQSLELGGFTYTVRCQVSRYYLSAHADGGELAGYVEALQPRRVALVHGDEEARAALRARLIHTDVLLPDNGGRFDLAQARCKRQESEMREAESLSMLPTAIGQGRPFDTGDLERLWQAIAQVPGARIVTARELALVWYGSATEEQTQQILEALEEDYEQDYFVPQEALEEAFRVRSVSDERPGDILEDLVGSLLFLLVAPESAKPVLCRSVELGGRVRVLLPKGVSQERTRFPFSAILEVLGPTPRELVREPTRASEYLNELVKMARRIRRQLSARDLAQQCQEGASYTLNELCAMAGLDDPSLEERIAVAKLVQQHPLLFMQVRSVFDGDGIPLYGLAPEWQEGLEQDEVEERPDQHWILSIIEKHLGTPPDLYRRSIDPESGDVMLSFHFPEVARRRYEDMLSAAEQETGVTITISPNAHQDALARMAQRCLPEGLSMLRAASIFPDRAVVSLACQGYAAPEAIEQARQRFNEETGWQLEIVGAASSSSPLASVVGGIYEEGEEDEEEADSVQPVAPLSQHEAMALAQRALSVLPGYQKVGMEVGTRTLITRFTFPDAATTRFARQFARLERETGWKLRVHPQPHHEALMDAAVQHLPLGLTAIGTPSMYHDRKAIGVRCKGSATPEAIREARQEFHEETGWQLHVTLLDREQPPPDRAAPGLAVAAAHVMFAANKDLYRVGVDEKRGVLWLHFHFPAIARERYAEQITTLEAQTGWKIMLHQQAHQKALIEAACLLFPEGVQRAGKVYIHHDQAMMQLTYTGTMSEEDIACVRRQFAEQTGWQLALIASEEA